MNRVNNHIYSMTRSSGIKDPLQPVVYQHPHRSIVDGVSSLLPGKRPFHITRIVRSNSESEDGVNGGGKVAADISNWEVDEMSTSEKDRDMMVTEHHVPLANILNKEIKHAEDGVQSRFRIVKIESKGLFKRGRWTCRDFADPPEAKASEVAETQSSGSSNAAEPVFYVQGAGPAASQLIFYSEGHPVLESDALPCTSKLFIDKLAGISTAESGSTLLSMCRHASDGMSSDRGLKSGGMTTSNPRSDGTIGTGLRNVHHDFSRVSWPAAHDEFCTPTLLKLVVDDSNGPSTAR